VKRRRWEAEDGAGHNARDSFLRSLQQSPVDLPLVISCHLSCSEFKGVHEVETQGRRIRHVHVREADPC
jgi:hypothetical protein